MSPLPILVVNPNTTKSMTDGLEAALAPIVATGRLPPPTFFTAPTGIPSINCSEDCHASATAVLPHLLNSPSSSSTESLASSHSAILIACYSVHPLVPLLTARLAPRPVLGIFEASILASLALLRAPGEKFGIVTTGAVWESILSEGVADFLGLEKGGKSSKFAGVQTTGLNAVELHSTPEGEVTRRLKDAVKRLIRQAKEDGGKLRAVCLGCAGMVGFDEAVRAGCVEELGEEEGRRVEIVDGVKAGYAMLEGMVRARG
ncbi:DCG1 protein [Rhodotorula toruloides ATCC 204091]|nr:DCG1 protein [Rhodotorula toruloides ATCC 204091]KAK4333824.1 Asp/Glu/Hydantoin racemase-domain containing protein [Rhodotorula toruloides]